jgi:hypothetical protein
MWSFTVNPAANPTCTVRVMMIDAYGQAAEGDITLNLTPPIQQ